MQKKVLIIIGVAVLLIAAIACSVFLISTADLEPESKGIEVEGTWRVLRKGSADPGSEYFVFDAAGVKDYRNGDPTPALESEYTLEGNIISIATLGQNYTIEKKSANVLLLYNESAEFLIIRCAANSQTATNSYSQADLNGKYKVELHANSIFGEEFIEFNGDKFVCVRNGETYLDTTYTINNNVISIVTPNGKTDFVICHLEGEEVRFAEISSDGSYLAWELVKVEE
ncbi:MAG: hypothetical protein J6S71_06150 [Clostridia bacterium]|nr:hypothetical protein [Clostridia bacterium]